MGKLIINRENNFIACLMVYNVLLDKKYIGKISNGEKAEFTIPNGKHTLVVKNIFDKSNTINFETDDFTIIIVECKMGFCNPKLSIKSKSNNKSVDTKYKELSSLQALKQKGIINEKEYEIEKNKILT